jgi:hypothetical protein
MVVDVTMLVGLKLQFDSDGNREHPAETVKLVPASPFWDVNVSTVDPVCPGALTLIAVGFAVTINVGGGFTISVMAGDVEPE